MVQGTINGSKRGKKIRKELWLNSWGKILDIEVYHSEMSLQGSSGRPWRI